jgi:hypothetical protein
LDGPATQLFTDFPKMSRAVTRDFHRAVIGRRVTRDALVSVTAFLDTDAWRRTAMIQDRIRLDL